MVGIIGGSGLYHIDGIENLKEEKIQTPFGAPSDSYMTGELNGRKVAFLPRHGRGHRLLPSEINHRANICGFKLLGAERIIAVSAVGSLREDIAPLDIVLPDQFFDRTKQSQRATFFGGGIVGHISFSRPVCGELLSFLNRAASGAGGNIRFGGVYVNMEGPAFSTVAESRVYRLLGFDIIGMTAMAEAKLSREAEICYANLAMVTDYDCWRRGEAVEIEEIISNLQKNSELARTIISEVVPLLPAERRCSCGSALEHAVITDRESIPAETLERLRPIIGKYFPEDGEKAGN